MSAIERRSAKPSRQPTTQTTRPKKTARRPTRTVAAALFILVLTAAPGLAQDTAQEPVPEPFPGAFGEPKSPPRVELFLSSLFASSATEGSFGVRGSWHRNRRFALEGSLSRVAVSIDIFLADFSAKYYLRDRAKTDVYVIGGPGAIWADAFDNTEATVHLGVGMEVNLSKRLYFRPELRGRWLVDAFDATTIGDLSLGLGWRL